MNHEFTTATAGVAIVSPFWLPSLQQLSEIASVALPILGALWLILQIAAKLYEVLVLRRKK